MNFKNTLQLCAMMLSALAFSQEVKEPTGRLEIAANYGIGGNFFVTSYNEQQPSQFYSKDFIGTIGGIELVWNLKDNKQAFGLSFDRSVNHGEKNISRTSTNNSITVENFNLRHMNKMYGVFYKRKFKSNVSAFLGFYLFYTYDQLLEIKDNRLVLNEISPKNQENYAEGGFFLGADYFFFTSGNFEVGIQSKLFSYFAISEFDVEAISLTPKIRYRF